MQPRKSKAIPKGVLSRWRKALKLYGAKADLHRQTGVNVQTIRNILRTGNGLEQNVNAMRVYMENQPASSWENERVNRS